MTKIPFIQYHRPDGATELMFVERHGPVAQKAIWCVNQGYRFEIEELSNGMISMTCSGYNPDIDEESDIAIELVANNPQSIPAAVDKLINRSHELVKSYPIKKFGVTI